MRKLILFFIGAAVVAVLYFLLGVPNAYNEDKETIEQLSENNMKQIVKDDFIKMLTDTYGKDVTIVSKENAMIVSVQGQGKKTNNFYNSNDALLKENDFDFSIVENANGSIKANFKLEEINKKMYVYAPIDVILGILKSKQ